MKISLRTYLINEIMREGYLPLNKVHALANSLNRKQSNAERVLRKSKSPMIESVYNEDGKYIIGYRYKEPIRFEEKEVELTRMI